MQNKQRKITIFPFLSFEDFNYNKIFVGGNNEIE